MTPKRNSILSAKTSLRDGPGFWELKHPESALSIGFHYRNMDAKVDPLDNIEEI
jgi:hypothetical protein